VVQLQVLHSGGALGVHRPGDELTAEGSDFVIEKFEETDGLSTLQVLAHSTHTFVFTE